LPEALRYQLTATILATATHATIFCVALEPAKVEKGLEKFGKGSVEAFMAQGGSENVDDVVHY
jgi:hypothetical protein